jgi:hypothetical protein
MNTLYIICFEHQLADVRELLTSTETVGKDSYCFRPNTFVIQSNFAASQYAECEQRHNRLCRQLKEIGVSIPMQ